MLVYIVILSLFLLGIYSYDVHGLKKNKIGFYYFLCLYLTLLAGLSYRLGGDGPSYEELFSQIPTLGQLKLTSFGEFSIQPLFLILASFSKTLINDVWLFHTLQSGIVCFTMFWFIRKYTKYIFTAGLIFTICIYTYFCFEVWKESLAVSMNLISFYYFGCRRYIRYILFGFVGFLFHFSGLFFLLFPVLIWLKFNTFFFLLLFGCWMLFDVIIQSSQVLMYSDLLVDKYDRYLVVAETLNFMWYVMAFCKNVVAPLIIGMWFKSIFSKYEFEWSYCVYLLLGLGTLQFAVIFERPMNYVLPFIVVSMAQLIGLTQKLHKHHIATVVISFFFCVSCRGPFFMSHEGWRVLVPYESIFTKKVNQERENTISEIHVG